MDFANEDDDHFRGRPQGQGQGQGQAQPQRPPPETPNERAAARTWARAGRTSLGPGGGLAGLGARFDADSPHGGNQVLAQAVFQVDHAGAFPQGFYIPASSGHATLLLRQYQAYINTCDESGVAPRAADSLILHNTDRAAYRTLAEFFALEPPPAPEPLSDLILLAVVRGIEAQPRGETTFAQVIGALPRIAPGAGALAFVAHLGRVENEYAVGNAVGSLTLVPASKMRANIADLLRTFPDPEQSMIRVAGSRTERERGLTDWAEFKTVVYSVAASLDLVSPHRAADVARSNPAADPSHAGGRGSRLALPAPRPAPGLPVPRAPNPVTCFTCGLPGHKSLECPSRTAGLASARSPPPAPAAAPWTSSRFPNTRDAVNVAQRRPLPPRPSFTAQAVIRAVTVNAAGGAPGPVRVEVGGVAFGAKPDTAMEGEVDMLMGRGAFDQLWEHAEHEPQLCGSALYQDVNGHVAAATIYATNVTMLDLRDGRFGDTATVLVPAGGDPHDETVLLSQSLLARAGVNVYDAFHPADARAP